MEHEHNCSTHYHARARCDCQTPSATLGHTEKPKCEKCGCPGVLNTAKADDGKNSSRCTVRVKTTTWADKRGLHTKKSLTFLRRQCEGFNVLAEDASAIGAEEVLPRILNFNEVEDGVYNVVTCNESRDYETGYVDDYDYRLVTPNA